MIQMTFSDQCEHRAVEQRDNGPTCKQCGRTVRTPRADEHPATASGMRAMWTTAPDPRICDAFADGREHSFDYGSTFESGFDARCMNCDVRPSTVDRLTAEWTARQ